MTKPSDEIADLMYDDEYSKLVMKLDKERQSHTRTRAALRHASKEINEHETRHALIERLFQPKLAKPKWLVPSRRSSGSKAVVCSILSDTHLDEVVNPQEVNGTNAFNRDIATARLRTYFDKLVTVPRDNFAGPDYDGVVVFFGGDMLSGDIHDELTRTNEAPIHDSVLYWSTQLAAGLDELASVYKKVHVACVRGNHSRKSRRVPAKGIATDSYDWLLSHMVARAVESDNITFDIPEESDARVTVLNTKVLLTHGDVGFAGGSGVGGAWTAIMRGDTRRRQRDAAADAPYDMLVVGHWHQLRFGNKFIINGALKGTDEYAYTSSFAPEPPAQALWLETSDYGSFGFTGLHVAPMRDGKVDAKKEGW